MSKFVSHRKEVEAVLNRQVAQALEICGGKAESYAKGYCPVDTGTLRNSISHKVDNQNQIAYIGTNVEYAPFVEFGTGIYYTGGRQTEWGYTDRKGQSHATHGMEGRQYLKKALANHAGEYRKILKDALTT